MKRWSFLTTTTIIVALVFGSIPTDAWANQFVSLTDEVQIPVPEGWLLLADSNGFPAQLIHQTDSAEILIFRSEIAGDDMISNETELRKSVDLVEKDVIGSLTGGQLLTSTGFFDGYRTGFTLEFESLDSSQSIELRHSLRGIIYRHPDDYQILFTVWGKSTRAGWSDARPAVELIQTGFSYRGPFEQNVFATSSMSYWPILLVVMAIIGLILIRPPWRRRKTPTTTPDTNPTG